MINTSLLGIVRNIPSNFHSSDLRSFFSQLIEANGFDCFHYKHRPEIIQSYVSVDKLKELDQTNVCVIKFPSENFFQQCINIYDNKNWINQSGDYLKTKCKIVKFSISSSTKEILPQCMYLTQQEKRNRKRHSVDELFSMKDLLQLSELNPPINVMPNGNVGTPLRVFQNLIRECALPSSVIKRLGLTFSLNGSTRRYGNVPFVYDDGKTIKKTQNFVAYTSTGFLIRSIDKEFCIKPHDKDDSNRNNDNCGVVNDDNNNNNDDDDTDTDSNDNAEEWERHESFHNDVTSQERSKERLFEEEIELKWEKGGSGLVFYTDAQYWAREEGDFDEQTSDDWDLDMSEYYGEPGDKDAKDFIRISKEKRLRDGVNTEKKLQPESSQKKFNKKVKLCNFEKFTNGFGRKVMEKMGWKDGQNLGPGKDGLLEPLEAEGQSNKVKSGLGYHGEKIDRVTASASTAPRRSEQSSTTLGFRNVVSFKTSNSVYPGNQFPQQKTVEPLASHSYIFPQFRSNLTSLYDKHLPFNNRERREAVPGIDGIVITTVFDDPLDVDRDSGILRSQHSCGLKRRQSSDTSNKYDAEPSLIPYGTGSKLIKRVKKQTADYEKPDFSNAFTCSSIKFVRPSNPADRFA